MDEFLFRLHCEYRNAGFYDLSSLENCIIFLKLISLTGTCGELCGKASFSSCTSQL